jgi:uncharacterized Zn-binding protein involved in type VI secretion
VADAASTTGRLLDRAAESAAKPSGSPLEVWTRSVEGAKEHLQNFDPTRPPVLKQSMEDLGKAVAGRDWNRSSWDGVGKGMAQQARALGNQALDLIHLGKGKSPQGVLGHIGAAFGLLTAAEQLVSMPLSRIPFPALPAVRIGDFDVGLPHGHPHPPNTPPAPPMMLPSTGPVIPIPFVSGAGNVLINGLPAARCGDMGLGIWCGGYFPLYEIKLGSSNVWIEGARAARLAVDVTTHCIFTDPKPAKPKDAPIGPMFGFTVSASSDVAIGGVPMPSLSAKVMGAAFKALFKRLGKLIGWLRGKLGGKLKGNFGKPRNYRSPGGGGNAANYGRSASVGVTDFVNLKSYQRACQLIEELKSNGKLKFAPDSSPEFIAKAEADLRLIGSSKTGSKILEDIKASGKKVVLAEGEAASHPVTSEGKMDFSDRANPQLGEGSDSLVHYNPDEWMGPHSPPDTVLAHELGHARNASKGMDMGDVQFSNPSTRSRWSNPEEMQNIQDIENPYRQERGLPERTGHDHCP